MKIYYYKLRVRYIGGFYFVGVMILACITPTDNKILLHAVELNVIDCDDAMLTDQIISIDDNEYQVLIKNNL